MRLLTLLFVALSGACTTPGECADSAQTSTRREVMPPDVVFANPSLSVGPDYGVFERPSLPSSRRGASLAKPDRQAHSSARSPSQIPTGMTTESHSADEPLPSDSDHSPLSMAAGGTPWSDPPGSPEFSATETLGRLVRGTLIVLVLLGVSLWGLRRWMKHTRNEASSVGSMTVLESTTLTGRCQLQLVEADGHRVLVGVDAGGVRCITVLPGRFDETLREIEDANEEALIRPGAHRLERPSRHSAARVEQPA